MEPHVQELENRLGFNLPSDYRSFLVGHRDQLLDSARLFVPPRSGVVELLLTANEILENADQNCIGIPEDSLMHIGGNLYGGYLYLKVSVESFGEVHYSERYALREKFSSFSAFLNETHPEAVE